MKKVLLTIALLIMTVSNVYSDTYYGTYAGDDNGLWAMYYDFDTNEFMGIAYSNKQHVMDFIAVVEVDGNTFEIECYGGAIFTVDISVNSVDGTWINDLTNTNGTITGSVIDVIDIQKYCGNKTLKLSSGESLQININTDGVIIGEIETSTGIKHPGLGIVTPDGNIFCRQTNAFIGLHGSTSSGKFYNSLNGFSGTYSEVAQSDNDEDDPTEGCFITTM